MVKKVTSDFTRLCIYLIGILMLHEEFARNKTIIVHFLKACKSAGPCGYLEMHD